MKHVFSVILASALFFAGCKSGDDKKTADDKEAQGNEEVADVKGMKTPADELTERMEKLKKLKQFTLEELRALLPGEFEGAKQKNYNGAATMGYSFVAVEYPMENKSQLNVQLFDCAGEMGAAYYSTAYWTGLSYQQETDEEYTRTIDFEGGRAIENYNKTENNASLTYFVGDRLLVVLDGKNMSSDEVKAAAKKLNIKTI